MQYVYIRVQVYDFIVQKLIALRKPKTNIQILQQSVLLKYKWVVFSKPISFVVRNGTAIGEDFLLDFVFPE